MEVVPGIPTPDDQVVRNTRNLVVELAKRYSAEAAGVQADSFPLAILVLAIAAPAVGLVDISGLPFGDVLSNPLLWWVSVGAIMSVHAFRLFNLVKHQEECLDLAEGVGGPEFREEIGGKYFGG